MIQADNGNWKINKDQFLVQADKFGVNGSDYTTLEKVVNRHDDHIDAYACPALKLDPNGYIAGLGIGIPYQTHQVKQTFIVHNGEVYIRAAAIKDATIKHS